MSRWILPRLSGRPIKHPGRHYRQIAEQALGRPLESRHPVHHFDGNRWNNDNTNLVICEDAAYYTLLEVRARLIAQSETDPSLFPWFGLYWSF
jgi:hypothetical protein